MIADAQCTFGDTRTRTPGRGLELKGSLEREITYFFI